MPERIVNCERKQDPNPPHAFGLLRARRERPRAAAPPSSVMNSRRSHSITSSARCWSMQRHVEAERLGGLEVDHQLELDRGLDGKLARLRALEDAIGIGRRAPKIIEQVISVGQQAAEFSEETERIDGRETVASRQRCDLHAMGDQ